jgi:environmental stress-induced protein Ves
VQHLKVSDYRVMPWKNGLGSTSEIEIFPTGASVTNSDFLWRVSWASVASAGPFSVFPGYQRLLCVWRGMGLQLNGHTLRPFSVHAFSGADSIHAEPLGPEVSDVGIIFRNDLVHAEMAVLVTKDTDPVSTVRLKKGTHYFFCAEGSVETCGFNLSVGETLILSPDLATEVRVKNKLLEPSRIVLISANQKEPLL